MLCRADFESGTELIKHFVKFLLKAGNWFGNLCGNGFNFCFGKAHVCPSLGIGPTSSPIPAAGGHHLASDGNPVSSSAITSDVIRSP